MARSNLQLITGLSPVTNLTGDVHHAGIQIGHIPASNAVDLYVGDLVRMTGAGAGAMPVFSGSQPGGGVDDPDFQTVIAGSYPDIAIHLAGDTSDVWGVIVGFEYDGDLGKQGIKYSPAGVERLARVATDPSMVYHIPANAALAASSAGSNADVTARSPVRMYGGPNFYLDAATVAPATTTLPLRLLGPALEQGNDPAIPYALWRVKINTPIDFNRAGV